MEKYQPLLQVPTAETDIPPEKALHTRLAPSQNLLGVTALGGHRFLRAASHLPL